MNLYSLGGERAPLPLRIIGRLSPLPRKVRDEADSRVRGESQWNVDLRDRLPIERRTIEETTDIAMRLHYAWLSAPPEDYSVLSRSGIRSLVDRWTRVAAVAAHKAKARPDAKPKAKDKPKKAKKEKSTSSSSSSES